MKTMQFEAVKVALKQDKSGFILTLCMHPDEIPEEMMRDYVGSRYQVVMVRIDQNERPMDRQEGDSGAKAIQLAGILCKDVRFWEYLHQDNQILTANEKESTDWIREYLGVQSRTELKTNNNAVIRLLSLNKEFLEWLKKI
jgi:hypothetical protein